MPPGMMTSDNNRSSRCPAVNGAAGILRAHYAVAELLEQRGRHFGDVALSSTTSTVPCAVSPLSSAPAARRERRMGAARQIDGDHRAAAGLAACGDRAARLAGEAVHLREAESGALADRLGGAERLEHPLHHSGGMPLPVSMMASATNSPCRLPAEPGLSTAFRADKVMVPPSSMASRALTATLTSASSNSPRSTRPARSCPRCRK